MAVGSVGTQDGYTDCGVEGAIKAPVSLCRLLGCNQNILRVCSKQNRPYIALRSLTMAAMTAQPSSRQARLLFWLLPLFLLIVAMSIKWFSLLPLSFLVNFGLSAPVVHNQRNGVSYRGVSTDRVEHFQNIFYAEDTSGINRFAPPIPYTPAPGSIVDATTAGAWCPQGLGGPPLPFTSLVTNVSENCLSLRIARPSGTRAYAKLPVLVWLHGGTLQKMTTSATMGTDDISRW